MGTAPRMLTPEAAARELGITPRQLDALARAALLSIGSLGGERVVSASEVARFKAGGRRE